MINQPVEQLPSSPSVAIWFYRRLLRLRPSQLGEFLKRLLRIRRRYVRTPDGRLFWVDPASQFGVDLMREGIYEVRLTRLLETVLRKDDTFIDIGANEGYFSMVACQRMPGGKVFAIEPQSRLQAVISENGRLNQVNNLILHRLALSKGDGFMKLYLRPDTNTGASSFFPKWKMGKTYEETPVTSLDRLFENDRIDRARLMKIDCEGAESLIFKGASETLARRAVDFIALEYHPNICGEAACRAIDTMLRQAGYELTSAEGHWIYHLPGLRDELRALGKLTKVPPWGT